MKVYKVNIKWVAFQTLCYAIGMVSAMLAGRIDIDIIWWGILFALSVFGWIICWFFGFKEEHKW